MNIDKAVLVWTWTDTPQDIKDVVDAWFAERNDDLSGYYRHFVVFAPRHSEDEDDSRLAFAHWLHSDHLCDHQAFNFPHENGVLLVYYRKDYR